MVTPGQPMEVEEENDGRRWSALPHLPLRNIADRLDSPADFCSFRLASASWRSVSEWAKNDFLASQPPWLFSADHTRLFCVRDRRFYRRKLPDNHQGRRKNWVVGFSSGHLILADHTLFHQLFLVDPFTGREVHRFPEAPHDFSRVVLTSPMGSGDCTLIVFNSTSMQYCRAGGVGWGVFRFPTEDGMGHVRNVAMFGGRAFALTADGKLWFIDFTPSPKPELLESESLPLGRFEGTWLGACGDNLVAVSCTYQPMHPRAVDRFVVRRFDFSSCGWVKMESLGDRALFVDLSWGVLSPDPSERGGSGDCIYFVDPLRNSPRVFHMEDGSMEDITPSASTGSGHGFRWDLWVWVVPSLCRR